MTRSVPPFRPVQAVPAHREKAPLAISSAGAGAPLHHDFGGFDRRHYTPPCATAPAHRVAGSPGRRDAGTPGRRDAGGH